MSVATSPRLEREQSGASGNIWYMGAKTRLLPDLERAIGPLLERARRGRPGPPVFVDLFSGTGVVAARFADRARVVANDIQGYAAVLARAALTPAPAAEEGLERVLARKAAFEAPLLDRLAGPIEREARFLEDAEGADLGRYRAFIEEDLASQDPEADAARARADGLAACLAATYWRNVYFGVRQSVALDALRAALEPEPEPRRTIYLASLLFAASRATSGTAHFAQPRGLEKASELRAMLGRRRISVEALFCARVAWLSREAARPLAAPAGNEVHRLDHAALFERLAGKRVDVIYADPPYTRDQYSRFYHVLETLVDYDYPALARRGGRVTAGRYPAIERRFQSAFASPAAVAGEFRAVTERAAALGAALVWSYSRTNGILLDRWAGEVGPFRAMLGAYYGEVEIEERALLHSGQGDKNHAATELIAVCTGPGKGTCDT
jgi:adenine-specific DNA-methyltransferase